MEKYKESFELYSNKILSLAANIPLLDRLPCPDITVTRRSKLCGSMVTVDLNIKRGVIKGYSHEVKACALGQASASILATDIIGKIDYEIVKVRQSVIDMLNGSNYSHKLFPNYHFLSPASQFKNRHDSILLVLDATIEAFDKIIVSKPDLQISWKAKQTNNNSN